MFTLMGRKIAGLLTALTLTACASPSDADNIYINTSISGELMPGVYGQVNIGNVPDYVMVYDEPVLIAPQPAYIVEPIYLYVPPYHAYHWRDHCHYYNACARPVYFVCADDYRTHYFEPRYYNSRVYEPPRVYRHGHSHLHPKDTLHQRDMNHQYERRSSGRVPMQNDRSHGTQHQNYQPRDNGQRDQNSRREYQRDDHRNDKRNDYSNDRQQPRQQYINTNREDNSRMPVNSSRQYQQREQSQSRGNWSKQNSQQNGSQQNNAVRIQHNTEMPTRQQQYSPQPKAERASFGNSNGGGRDDRRRDDRRER